MDIGKLLTLEIKDGAYLLIILAKAFGFGYTIKQNSKEIKLLKKDQKVFVKKEVDEQRHKNIQDKFDSIKKSIDDLKDDMKTDLKEIRELVVKRLNVQ